jgi:hypothetical protein
VCGRGARAAGSRAGWACQILRVSVRRVLRSAPGRQDPHSRPPPARPLPAPPAGLVHNRAGRAAAAAGGHGPRGAGRRRGPQEHDPNAAAGGRHGAPPVLPGGAAP